DSTRKIDRCNKYKEKDTKIKNKVIPDIVYPMIVMTMTLAIMVFLLVFIVPKFQAIFHDMLADKPLPGVTLFVINVSKFVQNHWLVLLGLLIATFVGYIFVNRTTAGITDNDRFKNLLYLF